MPSGVRSAPFALDASLCIRCLRQSRGPRNGPAKSLTRAYQPPLQNPRPFSSIACRAADATTINNAETPVEKPESRFPEPPPKSGITHLTNRRLIELKGSDAAKFLQGLTTNNVDPHKASGWYSAFLSAQGRVLWEGFIYPWTTSSGQNTTGGLEAEWSCLVEVEKTQVDALVKHLKRHKLRSKVEVRAVEEGELDVWAAWMDNGGEAKAPSPSQSQMAKEVAGEEEGEVQDHAIHLPDPRVGGFGHRFLLSNNTCSFSSGLKSKLPPAFQELKYTPLQSYTLRRYQWGIPEGSKEIIPDTALPMESNLDYMSAIDFRKGCYVGQELTIRTRHTGVIRKRILPVQMYGFESDVASTAPESWTYSQDVSDVMAPLQPGLDIKKAEDGSLKKGRSAGKYLTGIGNVGLALVRLEMMTDVKVSAEGGSYQPGQEFGVGVDSSEGEKVVKLKAFVPEWHRQREAEKEAEKAKKPKREE